MINLIDFNNNYKTLLEINKDLKSQSHLLTTNAKIKEVFPKIIKNCSEIEFLDESQFSQMMNLLESLSKGFS